MLKAIHGQEDREKALKKARSVAKKLEKMKFKGTAKIVRGGIEETLSWYSFPREHWRQIRTNNPLERILKEVRRRIRVVSPQSTKDACSCRVCEVMDSQVRLPLF